MNVAPELLSLLRRASRLAALTGAGVSQESGLRTFRDSHPSTRGAEAPQSGQVGLWRQYKPEDLASPQAFRRDPKLVWDWYAWRREAVKGVRPNPGHYALAEMEKHVPEFSLITQNVDGLHRMAGSQRLIELHGNIQRVRCADCYTFTETWGDDTESVPRCSVCGGLLRPDVVWFGESLPRDQLEAALEAAR
ncbi:MAG TPA: Sir2 family NAD-dependent protein deacetylase, partial [Nitrospiraceae bacterium]|nr:Sir2 family NAD-dependent protein deacetylase [Nitrospiraceae bacterium]